jgi:hypothetical protein
MIPETAPSIRLEVSCDAATIQESIVE